MKDKGMPVETARDKKGKNPVTGRIGYKESEYKPVGRVINDYNSNTFKRKLI
jgi:hypothetical protein|tara:strand:+ start:308 stop:463 length:156 start_codon:yes stop_codon:yes gene_type:complete